MGHLVYDVLGDLVPPVSRGRETRPLGGASLITQSAVISVSTDVEV